MEALEIVPPGNYHVYYRSHVENLPSPDDWLPWVHGWSEYLGYVKGSAYTGTVGESRRMEAIQCKIYQY